MAYNKFIKKDGEVLLDLTSDNITAADVAEGKTFHDKTGSAVTGTYAGPTLEEKTAIPTKEEQILTPAAGTYFSKVTVSAIPDEYEILTYFDAETDIEVV